MPDPLLIEFIHSIWHYIFLLFITLIGFAIGGCIACCVGARPNLVTFMGCALLAYGLGHMVIELFLLSYTHMMSHQMAVP